MNRRRAVGIVAAGLAVPQGIATAQTRSPYKLGATWPMTGPLAPVNNDFLKGGQIAVEEVNAAGGIQGHPLQLLIEDSQGTPQEGVAAMRKLVQIDNVPGILTGVTAVVTAQIPLADEVAVPTLGSMETPSLFTNSKYSFSHARTWNEGLDLITTYWKKHRIKRVMGLLINTAIGLQQSPILRKLVTDVGGTYEEALIDQNSTDFRGVIARASQVDPQVIMLSGTGSLAEATLMKQAREGGLTAAFWGFSNAYAGKAFRDAAGPYAEGAVFGGLGLDASTPYGASFVRKYRAEQGYAPGYPAGEIYDVVKIFAYAMGKAGPNGPAIRDAIALMKGAVPSVFGGRITMGADHYTELASATALWVVHNGQLDRLT